MKSLARTTLWRRIVAILVLILCLIMQVKSTALAAAWPGTELVAESGIVVDADTGAIIFEKNGEQQMYPASITKVMTALVVLKYADLTDEVTFSHDAVYNVDAGSSNAQIEEGDVLTVEACLHALLLKSANEAANALAEHISGSREAFAELMNEEAAKMGLTGTHFTNPSGLPDENHYTTARDMAIIGRHAFQNEAFMEIESHPNYTLTGLQRLPEGNIVYMEHQMMRASTQHYDSRVVAGKTGYTMAAGNTLITLARENGRRLVAVVLKSSNPSHYTDTRALLDIGFATTENIELSEGFYDLEVIKERLISDTVIEEGVGIDALRLEGSRLATVPTGTTEAELSYQLNYNLRGEFPEDAIAEMQYLLEDRVVGSMYVIKESVVSLEESSASSEGSTTSRLGVNEEETGVLSRIPVLETIPLYIVIPSVIGVLLLGFILFAFVRSKKEKQDMKKRRKERRERLMQEFNLSEEELQGMVGERIKDQGKRDRINEKTDIGKGLDAIQENKAENEENQAVVDAALEEQDAIENIEDRKEEKLENRNRDDAIQS